MNKYRNFYLVYIVTLLINSCTSSSKILYLQNAGSNNLLNDSLRYEPVLQPDDLISIKVNAQNAESAAPFNLPGSNSAEGGVPVIQSYLIDNEGVIDFPVVGKVSLSGLSKREANSKLTTLISDFVKDPKVYIQLLNFKVTVLGEVNKPGVVSLNSERITLLEAIGNAGDLTIYGIRTDILLIREKEGIKEYHHIDITKADFIKSPCYYLKQNDIIIVNPNKSKINGAGIGPSTGIIVGAISLLVTQTLFFFR